MLSSFHDAYSLRLESYCHYFEWTVFGLRTASDASTETCVHDIVKEGVHSDCSRRVTVVQLVTPSKLWTKLYAAQRITTTIDGPVCQSLALQVWSSLCATDLHGFMSRAEFSRRVLLKKLEPWLPPVVWTSSALIRWYSLFARSSRGIVPKTSYISERRGHIIETEGFIVEGGTCVYILSVGKH